MVLAGVGGRTIVEAQRNLSHAEFFAWAEYRKKRGPLNPLLRQESGFALLAGLLCAAHGIKGSGGQILTHKDFMPYAHDEPEATVEDFMKMLGKAKKPKGKKV